jgi:hypothetical protein
MVPYDWFEKKDFKVLGTRNCCAGGSRPGATKCRRGVRGRS